MEEFKGKKVESPYDLFKRTISEKVNKNYDYEKRIDDIDNRIQMLQKAKKNVEEEYKLNLCEIDGIFSILEKEDEEQYSTMISGDEVCAYVMDNNKLYRVSKITEWKNIEERIRFIRVANNIIITKNNENT